MAQILLVRTLACYLGVCSLLAVPCEGTEVCFSEVALTPQFSMHCFTSFMFAFVEAVFFLLSSLADALDSRLLPDLGGGSARPGLLVYKSYNVTLMKPILTSGQVPIYYSYSHFCWARYSTTLVVSSVSQTGCVHCSLSLTKPSTAQEADSGSIGSVWTTCCGLTDTAES